MSIGLYFIFFLLLEEAYPNDHAKEAPALVMITPQKPNDQLNRHHLSPPTTITNTNLNNQIVQNHQTIHPLTPPLAMHQPLHHQSYDVSRCRSSSLSSKPITANGVHHVMQSGEDSSQSSLNLSASSGYLSGSSANSSVGSHLNLSVGTNGNGPIAAATANGVFNGQLGQGATITMNGVSLDLNNHHLHSQLHLNGGQSNIALPVQPQQTNSRRRTISSNSNG